jgi:uncharacterized protein YukE
VLSPADIESLASEVDGTARRLAEIGDGLDGRARLAQWRGTAAEAFREDMRARRLRCEQDAETLRAIAAELKAAAVEFQSELDAISRLEDRIRTWLAEHADDAVDLVDWLPGPAALPPPGSPLWGETARTLGRLGARF